MAAVPRHPPWRPLATSTDKPFMHMMNQETLDFIHRHREDDVRRLALRASQSAGVDMPQALQQIQGWQTARRKLPSWAAVDGLVFPPHLNMEQCSSEATARYKAAVVRRLLSATGPTGAAAPLPTTLVDLTGGFGVDFSFLAPLFSRAVYVEQNEALCRLAAENFRLLGLREVTVVGGQAETYLASCPPATLFYLDPARRDGHGGRTYAIGDCTPDVSALLPSLLGKGSWLLLKLSPMLDWHKAVADLEGVCEVHIVAAQGECKELLLVLRQGWEEPPVLFCANDGHVLAFRQGECRAADADGRLVPVGVETACPSAAPTVPDSGEGQPAPGHYLYEPHAAIMKGGCFDALAQAYGVRAVGPDSHLFVASRLVGDFPGRRFRVKAVSTLNKKELRRHLDGLSQANLAVRHFPMTVADLRRRLKLADGGDTYIFATTVGKSDRVLLICEKAAEAASSATPSAPAGQS